MNPQQIKRRAEMRAMAERQRRREKVHRAALDAQREKEAFCRSAQKCASWVGERVDEDFELPTPSAHQRMRAAVFPDDLVLDFMRAAAPPEHPFSRMHFWTDGEPSDIRRAFPADATAEQIVVKLWDMKQRGLVEGNAYRGVFWLAGDEPDR